MKLPASLETLGEHALTDTYGWSPSMNGIQYITVQPENPYFYNDAYAFYRRGEHGDTLIKYFGKNETWKIPEEVTEVGPSGVAPCQSAGSDDSGNCEKNTKGCISGM